MESLIFIGILISLYGIIHVVINSRKPDYDEKGFFKGLFGGITAIGITFTILSILVCYTEKAELSPIDVYRGKTELKITETKIDSVVVKRDTVVVWKEEYK